MLSDYRDIQLFSPIFTFSVLFTLLAYALFFARAWLFYKKGVKYADQIDRIPTLSQVQYVFLVIGIAGPCLVGFIPLLGILTTIISVVMFIKILPEILSFKDTTLIKPEKIMIIGIGMGIAGICGFILGIYRGLEEKKTISTSTPENSQPRTEREE